MFLRVREAKGAAVLVEVGALMSITQRWSMERVPEVVAWLAEAGRMMCAESWLEIEMEVDSEKEGWRMRVGSRGSALEEEGSV